MLSDSHGGRAGGHGHYRLNAPYGARCFLTHYLKLAGERDKLEREKLRQETELVKAKAESIASAARTEELVKEAVDAMRRYSGGSEDVF